MPAISDQISDAKVNPRNVLKCRSLCNIMLFSILVTTCAMTLACHAVPAPQDEVVEGLTVRLGQRYEPLVEEYKLIKSRFHKTNPRQEFPGFIGTRRDREVPMSLTIGRPVSLRLQYEGGELKFPVGRLVSLDFSDAGELDDISLTPQLMYSFPDESKRIEQEIISIFEKAGWQYFESTFLGRREWYAKDVTARIFSEPKSAQCSETVPCELVRVDVERFKPLRAKIVACGEKNEVMGVGVRGKSGAESGYVGHVEDQAEVTYKKDCSVVHARMVQNPTPTDH